MKHKTSKIKRVGITALATVCMLSSAAAISASAISYSQDGRSVTVNSADTINGYTLKLSSLNGSTVGSLWSVTNGGPTTLKSKNSIKYVKTNGTTAVYIGNNAFVSCESTYQYRTVSTSNLAGYSRLAKVEASGYSGLIKTSVVSNSTVSINAYY